MARQLSLAARAKAGAAEGIRTPDPRITNAVLYRLSYRGKPTEWRFSNTRGLLTQDASPAYDRSIYRCGGVIETTGRGAYAAINSNEFCPIGEVPMAMKTMLFASAAGLVAFALQAAAPALA